MIIAVLVPLAMALDGHGAAYLAWRVPLPGEPLNAANHAERSGPVIVGDDILVGAAGGTALFALSRSDGSLRRQYPAHASVESSPVVEGSRLWFGDSAGTTWCYEVLTATPCWKEPHRGGAPVLSAPLIVNDVVIVTDVDDLVVGLGAADGALRWRFQPTAPQIREAELTLYARPSAVLIGDQVVVGFSDGSVVGLDPTFGDEVWTRRVGEGRYPDVVAEAVTVGSDIIVSGFYEPLVAIDRGGHTVRWRVDAGASARVAVVGSGLAAGVLHPGVDGVLRRVAALTGAVTWTWDSGTGGSLSAPLLTPSGAYVASSSGGLFLIDVDTGAELWRYVGDEIWTGVTAALAAEGDQLLVVTNAGYLYSFGLPQRPHKGETQVTAP